MSESVKLFSLDRMAKFKDTRNGDTVYIVPGEIVGIVSLDIQETWIEYGAGMRQVVHGSPESVEDEINRALGATYSAHVQMAEESGRKVSEIMKKLQKLDDDEMFNMNDFVPKTGVN